MLVLCALVCAGCEHSVLTQPDVLTSPAGETRLWAVAPFANESGVSVVDRARIADAFTTQLEQVEGIHTLAVNRVILAMRSANLMAIATAEDATRLMDLLDVDVLVVGTVTAYDPYPPPTLGMAVQAFTRQSHSAASAIDPYALVRAPSGQVAPGEVGARPATAQASGIFDARNNQTLSWLAEYAKGRTEPNSAFGPDVYLMNMELYTQFVSYRLIKELLDFERPPQPVEVVTRR